jgi:CheY-like chemotaxis protein
VGLALARQLIELHSGTIEAESPGLGLGSRFIVTLPVMAALTAQRPAAADLPAGQRERHRILLVDDNVDFAESLELLLSGMGHEVRVAHEAEGALVTAAQFRPDFAFLDIGLPLVNGYELARRMRAQPESAATILIAVSGWGQEQDRRQAEEAGFALHLVKPVELRSIETALESLMQPR